MSDQEVLALVNPIKGLAVFFWLGWMIVNSFIALHSKQADQENTNIGSFIFGGLSTAASLGLVGPVILGIQFAIFFQGMTLFDAHRIAGGGLFFWAGANLAIGLILLKVVYAYCESHPNDFVFGYLAGSSLSIILVGIAALGFGTLFGVISPETFFALKIYMQEWASNTFVLICFAICVATFCSWLAS